jgi:hypothetical protein
MKPEPLTPPDCDLRDFSWMPLDVSRLRDSDLAVIASGDAFRAAVLLWCASWHQVPAASLPTDDRLLANLAGYGRDMKGWSEIRDDALRGFVECSDGRLYHAVVAEKALEADAQRKAQKERTRKATDARRGGKRNEDRHDERNSPAADHRDVDRDVTRNEVQQTRPDQTEPDQTETETKTSIESLERVAPARKEAPPAAPSDSLSQDLKPPKESRRSSLRALGAPLPETWTPDEATCETVKTEYGMTDEDIRSELLAFHALSASESTFSANWSKSFVMFCKRWKEHKERRAPARVEVSKAATATNQYVPTERDWESTVKIYAQTGRWSHQFGPDPLSPACRCPPHLLEKHLPNLGTLPVVAAAKAVAS